MNYHVSLMSLSSPYYCHLGPRADDHELSADCLLYMMAESCKVQEKTAKIAGDSSFPHSTVENGGTWEYTEYINTWNLNDILVHIFE